MRMKWRVLIEGVVTNAHIVEFKLSQVRWLREKATGSAGKGLHPKAYRHVIDQSLSLSHKVVT
jgi:hypothetical protein